MPRPAQDIETGREVTRAAAPITIVNVPPQTRVDSPVRSTVSRMCCVVMNLIKTLPKPDTRKPLLSYKHTENKPSLALSLLA
jgi:hypothetical protein